MQEAHLLFACLGALRLGRTRKEPIIFERWIGYTVVYIALVLRTVVKQIQFNYFKTIIGFFFLRYMTNPPHKAKAWLFPATYFSCNCLFSAHFAVN